MLFCPFEFVDQNPGDFAICGVYFCMVWGNIDIQTAITIVNTN